MGQVETIFVYFLITCIVFSVFIELYKWWYSSQKSGYLFTNTISTFTPEQYAQTDPHLMVSSRNEGQGQEFSYSFWLIIRKNVSTDDQKERIVLSRGGPNVSTGHPSVYLGGKPGTLQTMTVNVRTYPFTEKGGDEITEMSCEVKDLPLRRWFHVAVCGRNNAVDVFINGRLAQHREAPVPLETSSGELYINQNGGFDGFMSKLHYGNYYYSYDSIYSMLMSGPASIPNLNKQYGTNSASGAGGGGLPDNWWTNQVQVPSNL